VKLTDLSENFGKYYDERYANLQHQPLEFKIGDRVRLLRGKTGIIKYIGPVADEMELIGIELDSWNPSGHNGKGFFDATNGRGYFTKRSEVVEIIGQPEKSEQSKIQIQRHRQMRNLQQRLYKIDQLEKKKARWDGIRSKSNPIYSTKNIRSPTIERFDRSIQSKLSIS